MEFKPFPKIPRLSRDCVISEKIDGTNGSVLIGNINDPEIKMLGTDLIITDELFVRASSRNQWITPDKDNYGFARWVYEHANDLALLGPGHHFGEWWGKGIQRGYNQIEKKFSLFNTAKWSDDAVRPKCCGVVPVLYTGVFDTTKVEEALFMLRQDGSLAAPGYPYPEGVVVFHVASNYLFKKTIEDDSIPKEVAKKERSTKSNGRRKINVPVLVERRICVQS